MPLDVVFHREKENLKLVIIRWIATIKTRILVYRGHRSAAQF